MAGVEVKRKSEGFFPRRQGAPTPARWKMTRRAGTGAGGSVYVRGQIASHDNEDAHHTQYSQGLWAKCCYPSCFCPPIHLLGEARRADALTLCALRSSEELVEDVV